MSNIRGLPDYGPQDADFDVKEKLNRLREKNNELFEKARVLGARGTLLGILRTINLIDKYDFVHSFTSWEEIHQFVNEYNIPENLLSASDIATIAAFSELEKKPELAAKINATNPFENE